MLIAPFLSCVLCGAGGAVPVETSDEIPLVDHARLTRVLHAIAGAHPDIVTPFSLGISGEGRPIEGLRLTGADPPPARAGLLLVANLDGPRVFSTSVALHHARALAEGYGSDPRITALLDALNVYIVPRANPDAAEGAFAAVRCERTTGGRGVDDDRDGRQGEDPPSDVNGDGMITWMRVRDPEGTWIPDPTEPRIMIEADRARGQRGEWKVLREGLDLDGDGEVAEDGPHDTVLNRNFPAGFEDHAPDAGLFPGDEPEARALMDFVIEHRDLVLVLTYDSLDDLVEEPATVEDEDRGRSSAPASKMLASDAEVLARIAKTYREITGSEVRGVESDAGSFQRWCYEHRGLWPLNAVLWDVPLGREESEATDDGEESSPSADARRLAWCEENGEDARFVPWTSYPHPTLGEVEIGGFAPLARTVPPAAARAGIADAQLDFVLGLGALVPRVELVSFTRRNLGAEVWKVEAVVENHAALPLQSRAALRARTVRPARLRLELSSSKMLLAGRIQELLDDLAQVDGRRKFTWLVRASGDTDIVLSVDTDHAGSTRAIAEVER